MLTQIRNISGIYSSTLQNWTKRGWVANAHSKRYNMDQIAHILIINMLRSCMQLDEIAFLIQYINGDVEDTSDDIISDSKLYDYICLILDHITHSNSCSLSDVADVIAEMTSDYKESVPGARDRLNRALEVIVITYYAAVIKRQADERLEALHVLK